MNSVRRLRAIILIALTACGSQADWFLKNVPRDQERFAREYLQLLRAGRADSAYMLLIPALRDSVRTDDLRAIGLHLEAVVLDSAKLVGANIYNTGAERHANLTFEAPVAEGAWMLANVYVKDGRISALHVWPTAAPLAETNAFRLGGKSAIHYITLLIAALVALVCLAAAISAIRSRLHRRWLWALLALVGITKFSVNWTTGAFTYSVIAAQLFGAGIYKSGPYAPWILSFSFPVGAIIVFEKLRRRSRGEPAA